jgi:hypothetical protein
MKSFILFASLLGSFLLAHCGAPDRTSVAPVVSNGGTAGAAGDAGTSSVNYTLENVCDLLPKQICELRAPCCNSSGVGFDRYYCEAQVHDHCVHNTAAVAAGDMTFKPEYLGPCLLEWQRLAAGCDTSLLTWNDTAGPIRACREAFRGTTPEGQFCWTDEYCQMSGDPNIRVDCHGVCISERRKAKGESCGFGDRPESQCDEGLYCAGSECKPSVARGAACTITPSGSNCDPLSFCDAASQTCVAKHDVGGDCTRKDQCLSSLCLGGVCQHAGPLFTHSECGK